MNICLPPAPIVRRFFPFYLCPLYFLPKMRLLKIPVAEDKFFRHFTGRAAHSSAASPYDIKEREISHYLQRGKTEMCLLCLLLYGCGNNARSGCGCNQDIGLFSNSDCGCGNARDNSCCGNARNNSCGCFTCNSCNRSCSGFGRHGNGSVCCDADYYNRQYALCCRCCCRVNSCCNN